jgi:hypothetical protein
MFGEPLGREANEPGSDLENGLREIRFETDRKVRILDKGYGMLLAATLFPTIVFFGIGIGLLAVENGLPIPLVIASISTLCLLSLRWGWAAIIYRLRFSVLFLADHLQVGRGLARCSFAYDDVEMVSLPHRNEAGSWVTLRCGGTTARVALSTRKRVECFQMVGLRCRNAVMVDEEGKVHLPPNANRPEQTLVSLERHYRTKMWRFAYAASFAGCMFSGHAWTLTRWMLGEIQPKNGSDIGFLCVGVPLFGFATAISVWELGKAWQTALRVRKERSVFASSDRAQGTADTGIDS